MLILTDDDFYFNLNGIFTNLKSAIEIADLNTDDPTDTSYIYWVEPDEYIGTYKNIKDCDNLVAILTLNSLKVSAWALHMFCDWDKVCEEFGLEKHWPMDGSREDKNNLINITFGQLIKFLDEDEV